MSMNSLGTSDCSSDAPTPYTNRPADGVGSPPTPKHTVKMIFQALQKSVWRLPSLAEMSSHLTNEAENFKGKTLVMVMGIE